MSYSKPTGPYENKEFDGVDDPAPKSEVNRYLAELASRCRVKHWSIEYNYMTDVNDTAKLELVNPNSSELACLKQAQRSPYLVLNRTGA